MPLKITYGRCGEAFWEGALKAMKPPDEAIQEVIRDLEGICPNCGKKLSFDPRKVEIHRRGGTSLLCL